MRGSARLRSAWSGAEGRRTLRGPADVANSVRSGSAQGRTNCLGEVGSAGHGEKCFLPIRLLAKEFREPDTLRGGVIEDRVDTSG